MTLRGEFEGMRWEGLDRTPLDDVDHLARSPHRARVIRLFADGDWTRRDLYEATGISQPTLGRILGSFQERHWLARDGQTYSLTPTGRLVATGFEALLDAVETAQRLPASVEFDPLLDLGFEPAWLARGEVAAPDRDDSYAHIRRGRESVRSADLIRELSPGPMPGMAEVIADRLRAGSVTVETVFPRDAIEAFVADPDDRALFVEMLETGRFRLYALDGSVPCYLARQGRRAAIELNSAEGTLAAFLTTTDEAVLAWVESVVDDYRDRAERVSADDLPPPGGDESTN
jgi:predicted transcriptional regulator